MALNRYKDAVQEYENTAKLFFEELGIRPSEHMMQQFEQMSSRLNYKPQELGDIKERLKEDDIRGDAFYCSLQVSVTVTVSFPESLRGTDSPYT